MTGAARLQVSGLHKRFGGVIAVKNMSFDLRAGEIVGLIGPNGSGKSTVMSLIMGIQRANAGTITLDGIDIAGWPAHRIARAGISIVFQHSRPLQRQTVLENIKLALLPDSLLRLATKTSVTERARAIAERVGLGGVLHRHPWTLPFADLRRMEVAKAVARDPKVVLIDEPFAGLTAAEIKIFSDLIRSLRDDGRAVLLVDHSVKSVAALADRVIAMYLGEPIAEGSADEVMQNETVRRVYLGGAIEAVERNDSRTDAATLLDVDCVDVFYGKAQALEHVDLRVRQDEFVSIVGLNGAGKTTLFNAISGLVPYRGSIRFAGAELRRRSIALEIWPRITGASPSVGSSRMRSFGCIISARPSVSICCSPPERVRAAWACRCSRIGNSSNTQASCRCRSPALKCPPPRSRFSRTLISPNSSRDSGHCTMPLRAIRAGLMPRSFSPPRTISPV